MPAVCRISLKYWITIHISALFKGNGSKHITLELNIDIVPCCDTHHGRINHTNLKEQNLVNRNLLIIRYKCQMNYTDEKQCPGASHG